MSVPFLPAEVLYGVLQSFEDITSLKVVHYPVWISVLRAISSRIELTLRQELIAPK
jgi:hypothetical protein